MKILGPLFPRLFEDDHTNVGGGEQRPAGGGTPNDKKKITCEFCECTLTSNGEYINLSETAKKMRKSKETIDEQEGTIATLRAEKEDLQSRLNALTTTSDSAKKLRFSLRKG